MKKYRFKPNASNYHVNLHRETLKASIKYDKKTRFKHFRTRERARPIKRILQIKKHLETTTKRGAKFKNR